MKTDSADSAPSAGREFSEKVLRYFLTFLETDFKKEQAPRRRLQFKSDSGFRAGIPLRKYATLYKAAWNFAAHAPAQGLVLQIAARQHIAPVSPVLRDLIRQHIGALDSEAGQRVAKRVVAYANAQRARATDNPERFVEDVQIHFAEAIGEFIVQPLLALLDGPFRENAYSAIESVYDAEADLTESVASTLLPAIPAAVNSLIVRGSAAPLQALFDELFSTEDIRQRLDAFFDDFATADAFQEMRDLLHHVRSGENLSLYLYLCDLRFGTHSFPLFYIPASLSFNEESRAFAMEFAPHLFVHKAAVDWILQEHQGESARTPLSPVKDRVIYLDGRQSFLEEMNKIFVGLIPALDLAGEIDLSRIALQQASSTTLKLSTAAYLAVFDTSDESLLNDYEELLAAFRDEPQGASRLFDNIIKGFVHDDPVSVTKAVDAAWDALSVPERVVADTSLPVNEEQRKILSALKDPQCSYVSVQGPPGTGKSHTITAIAFNAIVEKQSVLILSDKTEALDVVQDKLEAALQRVRHGDEDFPNPLLRLGSKGGTFQKLVSASAKEKIKQHHQASRGHATTLASTATESLRTLRADVSKTISALCEVRFEELNALHRVEKALEAVHPGLPARLQNAAVGGPLEGLRVFSTEVNSDALAVILSAMAEQGDAATLTTLVPRLAAWRCAAAVAKRIHAPARLSLFSKFEAEHLPILREFIADYERLRMPLFGWLFRGSALAALNHEFGTTLPCTDPIDVHLRLSELKEVSRMVGIMLEALDKQGLTDQLGFVYGLLRDGRADAPMVGTVSDMAIGLVAATGPRPDAADIALETARVRSLPALFAHMTRCAYYLVQWSSLSQRICSLPRTDFVGAKTQLEQVNTARLVHEVDGSFLKFVDEKKATVKEIAGVIKDKQKFPADEFHHLHTAFPVIIASIREYAQYVPLRERLFDLVVIDEASQVSVAQALPAVLRAKKVVVFGDTKQFSNVKSSQASTAKNAAYLADLEACFRATISEASTKIQRLRHFDVKRSILEFFDLIANYQCMLRKHFRGYQELISFSSKTFYDGQLQAIKIRSRPVKDVLRFEVLTPDGEDAGKNRNRTEAAFILKELRELIDEGVELSVGIITPFREQVKLLNDVLFRDAYADRFESALRLKIMTFDSCQGEERDLIIYSMVATEQRDLLNYVFPVDLSEASDKAEERLRMQRLNVGFSRGKEAFLFVLSKPVDKFRGSIGRVLMHYHMLLHEPTRAGADAVDPASPMEAKVHDWLYKTQFYQLNADDTEIIPQFPVGRYLKQLDPFYEHPAYRVDFLVRYCGASTTVNIVLEYDGFAEHFVEHQNIHNGNWDRYYRPEDIERQMVLESYGYKFLRMNRFNLGEDPVQTLSERLWELVSQANGPTEDAAAVAKIKGVASALGEGTMRTCPKCSTPKNIDRYWDERLKGGAGAYGRICMDCKRPLSSRSPQFSGKGAVRSWKSRYRWR